MGRRSDMCCSNWLRVGCVEHECVVSLTTDNVSLTTGLITRGTIGGVSLWGYAELTFERDSEAPATYVVVMTESEFVALTVGVTAGLLVVNRNFICAMCS